jgi:hypothetical protein
MNLTQRQLVEVPFNLPQGAKPHPVIRVSTEDAILQDDTIIGVMITHNQQEDDFTFRLYPQMFTGKLPTAAYQARLHLVSLFNNDDIITNSYHNVVMKQEYFDRMMERLLSKTFGYKLSLNTNLRQ